MASDNELQIIFGADTAPLRSEVKKATGIVDQFGNEVNSVANTASKGFEKVRQSFQKVPRVVNDLGSATKGLKTNSSSAALALNDLSRVAQDVPFGFIGIQNNINPLLESFRRLKAETGSTGGALKALAGSLTGFGGLGLALGVVTAAITIYQNGVQGFNRKTKEASKETETLADNLKSIDEITNSGRGSVAGDIAQVQALARGIADTNRSYQERKNLLNELKNVNNNYFGDLTLEESKLASLTGKVREYSAALVQAAITKKFSDQIADVAINLGTANKETDKALKKFEDAQAALNQKFPNGPPAGATAGIIGGINTTLEEYNKLKVAVDKTQDAFLKQNDISRKLALSHAELNQSLDQSVQAQAKYDSITGNDDGGKQKKGIDLLQQRINALKEIVELERRSLKPEDVFVSDASIELKNLEIKLIRRDGKSNGFSQQEIDDIIRQRFPEFETGLKFSKPIDIEAQFTVKPIGSDIISSTTQQRIAEVFKKNVIDPAVKAGEAARREINKPFEQLKSSVEGTIAGAFEGIGEAFGNILAGANPLEQFIAVIADALQQLGKALIAFGLAKKLAIDSLKTLNPFVAIAAGVGAIAAGALLKSQLNKQHKLAGGGLVLGPTSAMIGEAGPEMVIPLNRANQFLDSNSNIDITGDLRLRGTDLVLAVNRASSQRNRF